MDRPCKKNIFMSKYHIKIALVILIFSGIYLVYVAIALHNKSHNNYYRKFSYSINSKGDYSNMSLHHLMDRFDLNGPIQVKIPSKISFMANAKVLKDKYSEHSLVFADSLVDLCSENDSCTLMDIRQLIYKYFQEITTQSTCPVFKNVYKSDENFNMYSLRKDEEIKIYSQHNNCNYPDILQVLGFMLVLAVSSKTYLELGFMQHFIVESSFEKFSELLDTDLEYIDPGQFEIYKDVKNGDYRDLFKFRPNSSTPMMRVSEFERTKYFNGERDLEIYSAYGYNSRAYPLEAVAKTIFYTSYENSRNLMEEGMKQILMGSVITTCPKYDFTGLSIFTRYDFTGLSIFTMSDNIRLIDWKRHSDYNRSTRMFWKALNQMSASKQLQIYKLVTGFDRVPKGGFIRLPKTHLIAHDSRTLVFDSSSYTIHVPEYSSFHDMTTLIKAFVREDKEYDYL